MKYTPLVTASLVVSLATIAITANAQGYVPLAPLPIGEGGSLSYSYTMSSYLSGAIKLIIALGGALAILMAIIGGTQYVAAGISPDAKSSAKARITNAFIGLALILTSYLILNSINPKLVQFNLTLEKVTPAELQTFTNTPPISTATFREDSAVRDILMNNSQITINKSACVAVGDTNCTSVQNLNGSAVMGLRKLDENTCSRRNAIGFLANNCHVIVTGGTEYWLHQTHGDGTVETSTKVDLRKGDVDGTVDGYIKKDGVVPETPCGIRNAPKYQPDGQSGGTYVDEGDHWHVCY